MGLHWFHHDVDASADFAIRKLMALQGNAGYGTWWLLCEQLAQQPGYCYPVANDVDRALLAQSLNLSGAELDGFLATLADLGLIKGLDGGAIYNERFLRDAQQYEASLELSAKRRLAGSKGGRRSGEVRRARAQALADANDDI